MQRHLWAEVVVEGTLGLALILALLVLLTRIQHTFVQAQLLNSVMPQFPAGLPITLLA